MQIKTPPAPRRGTQGLLALFLPAIPLLIQAIHDPDKGGDLLEFIFNQISASSNLTALAGIVVVGLISIFVVEKAHDVMVAFAKAKANDGVVDPEELAQIIKDAANDTAIDAAELATMLAQVVDKAVAAKQANPGLGHTQETDPEGQDAA